MKLSGISKNCDDNSKNDFLEMFTYMKRLVNYTLKSVKDKRMFLVCSLILQISATVAKFTSITATINFLEGCVLIFSV